MIFFFFVIVMWHGVMEIHIAAYHVPHAQIIRFERPYIVHEPLHKFVRVLISIHVNSVDFLHLVEYLLCSRVSVHLSI